jgi:hypothetical protein
VRKGAGVRKGAIGVGVRSARRRQPVGAGPAWRRKLVEGTGVRKGQACARSRRAEGAGVRKEQACRRSRRAQGAGVRKEQACARSRRAQAYTVSPCAHLRGILDKIIPYASLRRRAEQVGRESSETGLWVMICPWEILHDRVSTAILS